ncbi:uncharacterized protein LOC128258182 [Drosophila gunungcola]|uniref:Chitin-binding type-2 domain-containing protein n=1 Tax=Drosophila gunungcola TaxID=103775 RepID=A0A9Q0BQ04_9MUSC|nr:uncharacterized protein LOC128258182 [Drosophila gunungcola]KAI8040472.1 hypothetical protein M5D96_006415 [Drosophila gunungcola]
MKLVLILLGGLLILKNATTFGQYFSCFADGICVCSGHPVGDRVPDCEDCSGYYQCGDGNVEKKKCSPGLIFNIKLQTCVEGQCPRGDGFCATTNTVPPPTTSTLTTGSPATGPPGGACSNEVKCSFNGEIIAHAQHCRLFYNCVELCPVLGFCELGKWFDREKFVCDLPENVRNCPPNQD